MNRTGPQARQGLSIPIVIIVASILFIMLLAFVNTRVQVKQQYKKTMGQVKAYYMAKGGVEHAIMKVRILPNESYQAGALARGISPFYVQTNPNAQIQPSANPQNQQWLQSALRTFESDIQSTGTDYSFNRNLVNFARQLDPLCETPPDDPASAEFWGYRIESLNVLSAHLDNQDQVHAVEIQMNGIVRYNVAGQNQVFRDRVTKVIEVRRRNG